MNWENLKTNHCPHCGQPLIEAGQIFSCTFCTFKIDIGRKMSIETHRAHPEKAGVKIKWQNLKKERCPICESDLDYGTGVYEVLACLNPNCTFKIRHDRFVEIMADPSHPCNQFYEREKTKTHDLEEE